MSNDVILRTFPDSVIEALAMLYVKKQDLSSATPETLLDIYQEAYDKIRIRYRQTNSERRHLGWSEK